MDKIDENFEKLGIYDLLAVLLSGIIITLLTIEFESVLEIASYLKLKPFALQLDKNITFIIISYLVGTIFQEIGAQIDIKILNKNCRLLKKVYKPRENHRVSLMNFEAEKIVEYVSKKIGNDDEVGIYNYCKESLKKDKKARSDAEKNQSLSGFSRSLCIYFSILVFSLCLKFVQTKDNSWIIYIVIGAAITILFYQRWIRFIQMRYVGILKSYYYKIVMKQR